VYWTEPSGRRLGAYSRLFPFREERKLRVVATVEQLAALVRGRLVGDGNVPISAARPVGEAGPGDITFIESERYAKMLRTSPASAAIVGPHIRRAPVETNLPMPMIEVDDPILAFLAVRSHLVGESAPRWTGVHPQAWVAPTAQLGADVAVYPFVYVGDGAIIGDGTTLFPGAVIGERCRLGRGVTVHPNAVLYRQVVLGDRVEVHAGTVLGGDGFGYRLIDGQHVKIPQTGVVEVGDDVEIGANCTVDRATFEATRIGAGSKIDNLVMIGHNNQIGRHNLLCGQVGIAGSCKTGDYVIMAGQAGIKDKTEIGDRVMVGAQAGVHRNIPGGQQVLGSPAIPVREQRRLFQMIARLPEMHKQLRELAAQVSLLMAAIPQRSEPEADPTGF
jgi:UDP-3-O-[3-hydroxymyristoyl] glucosamine N-acyltransferase